MIVALDTETFYRKRYSVADLGVDRYAAHPDFKVTLVSIVCEDGFEWVGPPQQLPVERLNGQTLISHNAEFDSVVCRSAITRGQMPSFTPADWHCTADMVSYFQLPDHWHLSEQRITHGRDHLTDRRHLRNCVIDFRVRALGDTQWQQSLC